MSLPLIKNKKVGRWVLGVVRFYALFSHIMFGIVIIAVVLIILAFFEMPTYILNLVGFVGVGSIIRPILDHTFV